MITPKNLSINTEDGATLSLQSYNDSLLVTVDTNTTTDCADLVLTNRQVQELHSWLTEYLEKVLEGPLEPTESGGYRHG